MKKVLVTGGSGFIGTNLVDVLLKNGATVLNVDKSEPVKNDHRPYYKGVDILDRENLERAILDFDPEVIVHLAAITDLDGTTDEYYRANIEGTQNIIDIAEKVKSLKKVLYTSSMYVCQPGYIPKNYDDYKAHTVYGQSKVKNERMVKAIKNPRYSWVIVRPSSIWGPWFSVPYIIFFNVVYQGRYFDIGNTCTKTYGYVENTAYQILKLIEADNVHGKTFYLGDEPPTQISEWANEISVEMGKGKVKKMPFFVIRMAALVGDVLSKVGIKFPITSFRLTNMTTNNILPLKDLYTLIGPPPVSRVEGVRKTVDWLVAEKGYELKQRR